MRISQNEMFLPSFDFLLLWLCTCWANILHLSSVSRYSLLLILSNSSPPLRCTVSVNFFLSFLSSSYLKVLSQDDALQAWLKVLLQVQDGSALFHLHLGRCQLVFLEGHLGKDLKLVSSVSQVLGPRVLLVLCCEQLLVRFPLANNFNKSQRSYSF